MLFRDDVEVIDSREFDHPHPAADVGPAEAGGTILPGGETPGPEQRDGRFDRSRRMTLQNSQEMPLGQLMFVWHRFDRRLPTDLLSEGVDAAAQVAPGHAMIVVRHPVAQVSDEIPQVPEWIGPARLVVRWSRVDQSQEPDFAPPILELPGQFLRDVSSRGIAHEMQGTGRLATVDRVAHRSH